MLSQKINNAGIVYSVNINGIDIHFREWSATDDCIYYFPLATLVDNGNARFYKNECTIPFESIYLLDDEDKKVLGLPNAFNKFMRLRGNGMLNTSDFSYTLDLLTAVPDGEMISYDRNGNIISFDNKN